MQRISIPEELIHHDPEVREGAWHKFLRTITRGDYFLVQENAVSLLPGWHYVCPGNCFEQYPHIRPLDRKTLLIVDERNRLSVEYLLVHPAPICKTAFWWTNDHVQYLM